MKFEDLKVGMKIRKIGSPITITAIGKHSAIGLANKLNGFDYQHEILIEEEYLDHYEEVPDEV